MARCRACPRWFANSVAQNPGGRLRPPLSPGHFPGGPAASVPRTASPEMTRRTKPMHRGLFIGDKTQVRCVAAVAVTRQKSARTAPRHGDFFGLENNRTMLALASVFVEIS